MKLVALVTALILTLTAAFGQSAPDPFLVSADRKVKVLLPKEHLVSGLVMTAKISPDGRYAFVSRFDLRGPELLDFITEDPKAFQKARYTMVDADRKSTVDLPGLDPITTQLEDGQFTANGVFVGTFRSKEGTRLISVQPNGRANVILTIGEVIPNYYFCQLPNGGLAVRIVAHAFVDENVKVADNRILLISPQGQLTRDLANPISPDYVFMIPTPDAAVVRFAGYPDDTLLNLNTGATQVVPSSEDTFDGPESELTLLRQPNESAKTQDLVFSLAFNLRESDYVPTDAHSPETGQGRRLKPIPDWKPAVFGINLQFAELADDEKSLFIADTGGLYRIPVADAKWEDLEAIRRRAVQNEAMQRAKQIGTAMMIYGADYDDHLPLSNNWVDAVNPYAKNEALFKNFNYLLNGQNLTDIENPSETVLGIISTEYGDAIVYADSHVKWRPNPPRPKPIALTNDQPRMKTLSFRPKRSEVEKSHLHPLTLHPPNSTSNKDSLQ